MKRIKGFEDYLINVFGDIYSMKSNIWLKQCNDKYSYLYINLCKKGKYKKFKVHRLVAETFIPNPDNKPQVNHKDGNKQNNHIDNLEWVTCSENHIHAYKIGLENHKGINHPQHKLTKNDVLTIRDLYLNGMKQREIGKIYGIHQAHISNIVNIKTWKHLIGVE